LLASGGPALGRSGATSDGLALCALESLRRKILKQRGHDPRRELFEQAYRSWHVPVAEMHQRKVLGAEMPCWHDFNKAAVAHEVGLHNRRQVTNAAAGEKRECQAGKVVHRQVWLKC